jgi:hypothetical protein
MELFREFFKIIGELNKEHAPYAVIGGIALAFYDLPRFTKDIDILGNPASIGKYEKAFKTLGYFRSAEPWTFAKTNMTLHRFVKPGDDQELIIVDLLIGHEADHERIIHDAVSDESYIGTVKIANREDLIRLKRLRNSEQDQLDIKRLLNEQDRKSDG